MTTPISIPDLERPSFFDGQRLEADDLAAMYDFHRELRWLHNRSLHNWGVSVGFGVQGAKGGRQVTVSAGYAIDCNGHDLLLSRPVTIAVPAVSGTGAGAPMTYYLTASYIEDADLAPTETRAGECQGSGAVRRVEAPLLRWQDPRAVGVLENRWRRGRDIVLASVQVLGCALVAAPSLAERRSARPEVQPFVAAGSTPAGETEWRFYSQGTTVAGVEATVDTSSAGFQRAPAYTAQVVGTRVLKAATSSGKDGQMIDGFASVVSPTSTSFVLRLLMPRGLQVGAYDVNPAAAFLAPALDSLRTSLQWSVSWMGIEG